MVGSISALLRGDSSAECVCTDHGWLIQEEQKDIEIIAEKMVYAVTSGVMPVLTNHKGTGSLMQNGTGFLS